MCFNRCVIIPRPLSRSDYLGDGSQSRQLSQYLNKAISYNSFFRVKGYLAGCLQCPCQFPKTRAAEPSHLKALPIPPPQTATSGLFVPIATGSRTNICSSAAIRLSCELKGEAEAQVVVAVRRRVVVAVRSAAVLRVVVPAAAAVHPVRSPLIFDL